MVEGTCSPPPSPSSSGGLQAVSVAAQAPVDPSATCSLEFLLLDGTSLPLVSGLLEPFAILRARVAGTLGVEASRVAAVYRGATLTDGDTPAGLGVEAGGTARVFCVPSVRHDFG